eukprot:4174917-Pleurochrysis_carterae.AAC.1
MAAAGQIDLAHAYAAWKCGQYYDFHVAPWGNAAGAMKRSLSFTPVGFLTMVALPTLHCKGIGRPPYGYGGFSVYGFYHPQCGDCHEGCALSRQSD